jgi:hypothetical protein
MRPDLQEHASPEIPGNVASALLWKEMTRDELTMATHDTALAIAAEAYGLQVVGSAGKR